MRNLITSDLFKGARLIRKMGINEEMKKFSESLDPKQSQESVGIDLMILIFEKATEIESEELIYEFLSGPFEMPVEDIANMDLFEMVDTLFKIADLEKWQGFLKNALR